MQTIAQLAAAIAILLPAQAQAQAQSPPPTSPLAGVAFLIGDWNAGEGQVGDTGGTSRGRSTISTEVRGNALLRRDHTDLFDKNGNRAGSFDQLMLIYPEAGTLHADYTDGTHIIHYTSATVIHGRAITFTSAAGGPAPTFRLTYTLADSKTLAIAFEMAPPGGTAFHTVATGTLRRATGR